ncbi:MAG: hypothetical protein O7B99_00650 [Planctomycetota bacterium]|nr:hypothetical protein [Planctomycetota bacterium]
MSDLRSRLWVLAKILEGVGMVLVLAGVIISMRLGFEDEGLESMAFEMKGLLAGGALFLLGWLLERWSGTR